MTDTRDEGIIRVVKNRENPYTVVNGTAFNDPRLTWAARGLMGYFLTKPDDWKIMVKDLINKGPKTETGEAVRGNGRDAVYALLKELQEHGYIKREPVRDPKTRRVLYWSTAVYEVPVTAEPLTARPDLAEPDTARPHMYLVGNQASIQETHDPESAAPLFAPVLPDPADMAGPVNFSGQELAPQDEPAQGQGQADMFEDLNPAGQSQHPVEPMQESPARVREPEPVAAPVTNDLGSKKKRTGPNAIGLTLGAYIGAYASWLGYTLTSSQRGQTAKEVGEAWDLNIPLDDLAAVYRWRKTTDTYYRVDRKANHLPFCKVVQNYGPWQQAGKPCQNAPEAASATGLPVSKYSTVPKQITSVAPPADHPHELYDPSAKPPPLNWGTSGDQTVYPNGYIPDYPVTPRKQTPEELAAWHHRAPKIDPLAKIRAYADRVDGGKDDTPF